MQVGQVQGLLVQCVKAGSSFAERDGVSDLVRLELHRAELRGILICWGQVIRGVVGC